MSSAGGRRRRSILRGELAWAAAAARRWRPCGATARRARRAAPGRTPAAEEEKNDREFAKKLAELVDVLVSDAFSCSHRAHASVEALARLLPSAAGRLMQAEIEALTAALEAPKHPAAALIGGAKISTKLDVLGNLTEKVDQIIIGGAMANTFLAAQGKNVGKSLCEHEMLDNPRAIMETAKRRPSSPSPSSRITSARSAGVPAC